MYTSELPDLLSVGGGQHHLETLKPMHQTQSIEQIVRALRRKVTRGSTRPLERLKIEKRMMKLQSEVAHLYCCMSASNGDDPRHTSGQDSRDRV